MVRKGSSLVLLLCLFLAARVPAQESAGAADGGAAASPAPGRVSAPAFSPFVSQLKGELRNNMVRLTWVDSPDVKGPVYIYRSQTPFEGANPGAQSKRAEVPYGAQSYIDEPEGLGLFYYYLTAGDETGQRYNLLIPFANNTSVTIAPPSSPESPQSPDIPWEAADSRPAVTSITARVEGDGVVITFEAPKTISSLVLYRSVQPFRAFQDLLSAVIVGTALTSPFIDYPVPGISYYYTLIPEEDIIRGTVSITPGRNTTTTTVEISLNDSRVGLGLPEKKDIRAMPLPTIAVETVLPGMDMVNDAGGIGRLSPEAAKAVSGIIASNFGVGIAAAVEDTRKPRAFSQDLETPAGGENYTVRSIIQGPFAKKDWPAARDELIRFLALPRTRDTEARARFYLGQALYFCGNYQDSLFEFLRIQTQYPGESQDWIQANLTALSK